MTNSEKLTGYKTPLITRYYVERVKIYELRLKATNK